MCGRSVFLGVSYAPCVLWTKLLMNTNRKPYSFYLMVPLSITFSDLWPGFQSHDIFRQWISQKRHEIEPLRTSIGSRMRTYRRVIFTMTLIDGPLTRFSRSRHFWSRIYQKRCILRTKLLKNTNRKWYTIYRMIPFSMTLSDLWPGFQDHDIAPSQGAAGPQRPQNFWDHMLAHSVRNSN